MTWLGLAQLRHLAESEPADDQPSSTSPTPLTPSSTPPTRSDSSWPLSPCAAANTACL